MTTAADELLISKTAQADLPTAIAYIAEGCYLGPEVDRHGLLQAICLSADIDNPPGRNALRRLAREVAESNLSTASVLLCSDLITPPSTYRKALDSLAAKCPSKSLAEDFGYRPVLAAQRENPHVIATLAAIAGLSWVELASRAKLETPSSFEGPWSPETVRLAFDVISAVVENALTVPFKNILPSRPIEMLGDPVIAENQKSGWALIEQFRSQGVPYEMLLAQRVEGGAWRTHRDRTGSKFAVLIADEVCAQLDAVGIKYLRTHNCGGPLTSAQITAKVGGGEDQIGIVVLNSLDQPKAVVAFSVANDGGSAAKSGIRLKQLPPKVQIPAFFIVAGFGWTVRNETADLAQSVGGRLYSDKNIPEFVHAVAHVL